MNADEFPQVTLLISFQRTCKDPGALSISAAMCLTLTVLRNAAARELVSVWWAETSLQLFRDSFVLKINNYYSCYKPQRDHNH